MNALKSPPCHNKETVVQNKPCFFFFFFSEQRIKLNVEVINHINSELSVYLGLSMVFIKVFSLSICFCGFCCEPPPIYNTLWAVSHKHKCLFIFTGMLLWSVSPPVWAEVPSIPSDGRTCIARVNIKKRIVFLFHFRTCQIFLHDLKFCLNIIILNKYCVILRVNM